MNKKKLKKKLKEKEARIEELSNDISTYFDNDSSVFQKAAIEIKYKSLLRLEKFIFCGDGSNEELKPNEL